jgi:hypothetical protein
MILLLVGIFSLAFGFGFLAGMICNAPVAQKDKDTL